jgi:N-acetylglucosamine-6-phosphate deacetylase
MKTYFSHVDLVSENHLLPGKTVVCENRKIIEVSDSKLRVEKGSIEIEGVGNYLCPGFIDIHFHGAMGVDTMDGKLESLQVMSDYCAKHGVTTFYPTTLAASPDDIMRAIKNVQNSLEKLTGARPEGVHIESPYINSDYKGAQLASAIRNPVKKEYQQWFDTRMVKLITCAPEIPGGMEFIKEAVKNNIRISIGHSGATYEEVIKAAESGATQATHLFNGMLGLHHREPGTVGGILADNRISAQIICDGVHLHPAVVKLIVIAKSTSKVILITDSISGAGLPDGEYSENGFIFTVKDGVARTPEGNLSGSTLSLDEAVRNTIKFTGKPIEEVIPMVTSSPATEMGIATTRGKIKVGYDADLVLVNKQLIVEKTIVNGRVVYSRL